MAKHALLLVAAFLLALAFSTTTFAEDSAERPEVIQVAKVTTNAEPPRCEDTSTIEAHECISLKKNPNGKYTFGTWLTAYVKATAPDKSSPEVIDSYVDAAIRTNYRWNDALDRPVEPGVKYLYIIPDPVTTVASL